MWCAGERKVGPPGGGSSRANPVSRQAFDALTFTYLLRYVADPAATLREWLEW